MTEREIIINISNKDWYKNNNYDDSSYTTNDEYINGDYNYEGEMFYEYEKRSIKR